MVRSGKCGMLNAPVQCGDSRSWVLRRQGDTSWGWSQLVVGPEGWSNRYHPRKLQPVAPISNPTGPYDIYDQCHRLLRQIQIFLYPKRRLDQGYWSNWVTHDSQGAVESLR